MQADSPTPEICRRFSSSCLHPFASDDCASIVPAATNPGLDLDQWGTGAAGEQTALPLWPTMLIGGAPYNAIKQMFVGRNDLLIQIKRSSRFRI
jgi:hypothetical protein